jgi:hypothetical protein
VNQVDVENDCEPSRNRRLTVPWEVQSDDGNRYDYDELLKNNTKARLQRLMLQLDVLRIGHFSNAFLGKVNLAANEDPAHTRSEEPTEHQGDDRTQLYQDV